MPKSSEELLFCSTKQIRKQKQNSCTAESLFTLGVIAPHKMLKRLLIKGLGTSVLQIVIYIILLYVGAVIANILDRPTHRSVDRGLTIYFSLLLFASVVLILNIVTALVGKKRFTYIGIGLTLTFYIIGWGEDFNRYPYKTMYLLIMGGLSLILKLPIDKFLTRFTNRHHLTADIT